MAKNQKKAIGKGIRALLNNMEDAPSSEKKGALVKKPAAKTGVAMLPLSAIEVNPSQPRTQFDEDALSELADSIRMHGLIQPITVRRLNAKSYQLISGERRLRASKIAELKEIPAYIREADDRQMHEMALIENIQREDLNAIEIAVSYQMLIDEYKLTQETISERVGKKRSTITNYLRLLKLHTDIQAGLKNKKISMGHARALAGIRDLITQCTAYEEVIDKNLSVRETEDLVKKYNKPLKEKKEKSSDTLSDEYLNVQKNLRSRLGTKVVLKANDKGKGQITIPFTSVDNLNDILDLIGYQEN